MGAQEGGVPVLTDAKGRPIEPPPRQQGESFLAFVRRMHAWRDAVIDAGNAGFDAALREGGSGGA